MANEIYQLAGYMPKMFKDSDNPQMPYINVASWVKHLNQDAKLVEHFTPTERLRILWTAGYILSKQPDEYFQYKTYKRSPESVQNARQKIDQYGGGWFYFGMTHMFSWKWIIDIIVRCLNSKSVELIWLEKMGPALLVRCPKCQTNMISYTSCVTKVEGLDHRITCKECADHDS
jgi:hypothetical protein